jgi:hypothetical protein
MADPTLIRATPRAAGGQFGDRGRAVPDHHVQRALDALRECPHGHRVDGPGNAEAVRPGGEEHGGPFQGLLEASGAAQIRVDAGVAEQRHPGLAGGLPRGGDARRLLGVGRGGASPPYRPSSS